MPSILKHYCSRQPTKKTIPLSSKLSLPSMETTSMRVSYPPSSKFLVHSLRKKGHSAKPLQEALAFLQGLSTGQRVFLKQVCFLTSLILVMPATNAGSEWSFSNYLRSTMDQAMLNHLMLLNACKEKLDGL